MFTCPACFGRAITGLSSCHPLRDQIVPWSYLSATLVQRATHSTWANIRKPHHLKLIRATLQQKKKQVMKQRKNLADPGSEVGYPTQVTKVVRRTLAAREKNNATLDTTLKKENSEWAAIDDPKKLRALEKELEFLRDPLRLANHISTLLRDGEEAKAIDLIKVSQKNGIKNIVSWNNLLSYMMHTKQVNPAIRAYNETGNSNVVQMKKRGTRPDSFTYMMMLRGLAQNVNIKGAVAHALSIYTSMSAPNSISKPRTGHSNAVISVCARAGDLDAMFGVAGKMPDRGPNSPDAWTYSIILSAFSEKVKNLQSTRSDSSIRGSQNPAIADIREAVEEGCKVWEDVIRKWRAGDIRLDEPLVVAMGHLILSTHEPSTARDIFPLIQQTTGIYIPESARKVAYDGLKRAERESLGTLSGLGDVSSDLQTQDDSQQPSPAYVPPGNGVLTLCLRAARSLSSIAIARDYMRIFADSGSSSYIGSLDETSCKEYFRILDLFRASREAVDFLKQLIDSKDRGFEVHFTFVMAMNVCKRDINNPNVFDNATRILDLLPQAPEAYDPRIMISYLEIARGTTPGQSLYARPEEPSFKKDAGYFNPDPENNNLLRAIRLSNEFFRNARRQVDRTFRFEDPFAPHDNTYQEYRKARVSDRLLLESTQKLAAIVQSSVAIVTEEKRAKMLSRELREELQQIKQKVMSWTERWSLWTYRNTTYENWGESHTKFVNSMMARRRLNRGGQNWSRAPPEERKKAKENEDEDRIERVVNNALGPEIVDQAQFPHQEKAQTAAG
ncbi:MAG: hypothetical protein Q9227_008768 [Pyrenula ochraceoflavens]